MCYENGNCVLHVVVWHLIEKILTWQVKKYLNNYSNIIVMVKYYVYLFTVKCCTYLVIIRSLSNRKSGSRQSKYVSLPRLIKLVLMETNHLNTPIYIGDNVFLFRIDIWIIERGREEICEITCEMSYYTFLARMPIRSL